MGHLLAIAVLTTLLLELAAATSPVVDPSLPATAPMEPIYPDPDGILSAICELCGMSLDYCAHALIDPSARPTFTPATFYEHPEWPQDFAVADAVLDPVFESEFDADPYYDERPLFGDVVQQLEDNATTVQPSTVQVHVEGTYNPGDRIMPPTSRRLAQRRQPPRPGGFPCRGCAKTFDRSCDLRRHQKTHQQRSERPHKCSLCGEGFLYPKDKKRHERTHDQSASSQAMLYCDIPGCTNTDGFSRRDNLRRHQRKQHPILGVA